MASEVVVACGNGETEVRLRCYWELWVIIFKMKEERIREGLIY